MARKRDPITGKSVPPKGFASWHDYNVYRVSKARDAGYSTSQAYGHPRKGELLKSVVDSQTSGTPRGTWEILGEFTGIISSSGGGGLPDKPGHIYSRFEGPHDYEGAQREYDRLGLSPNFAEVFYDEDSDEWDIYYYDQSE